MSSYRVQGPGFSGWGLWGTLLLYIEADIPRFLKESRGGEFIYIYISVSIYIYINMGFYISI